MLLTDSKLDLFLILKDKFQHKLNLIKVKASIYNMSSLFFLQTKRIDSLLAGFSPRHLQGSVLARILLILRQLTGGGASLPDTARSRQRVQCPLLLGLHTSAASTPVAVVPDTGEVTAHTRLANIGTIGNMSPASLGLGGGIQTVKHASYYLQQLNTETVL